MAASYSSSASMSLCKTQMKHFHFHIIHIKQVRFQLELLPYLRILLNV